MRNIFVEESFSFRIAILIESYCVYRCSLLVLYSKWIAFPNHTSIKYSYMQKCTEGRDQLYEIYPATSTSMSAHYSVHSVQSQVKPQGQ